MSDPVVVAMGPPGIKGWGAVKGWGPWQFPRIGRLRDGRLAVSIFVARDTIMDYGLPRKIFVSSDKGRHWRPIEEESIQEVKNLIYQSTPTVMMPDGEEITILSQRPYKETDINLPESLNKPGEVDKSAGLGAVFYRIGDFPREIMAMKLLHRPLNEINWVEEKAYLDIPEWTIRHLSQVVAIPHLENVVVAPDGSLLALESVMVINKNNRLLSKYKIICLRSVDRGHTWKFWSEVASLPDSEHDKNLYEPRALFVKENKIICVIRSSDTYSIKHCMYVVCSTDMGRIWTSPKKITNFGVFPQLLRLKNNVIVLSYGRPGVYLRFSADEGKTWGSPITIHGRKLEGLSLDEYRKIRYKDTCGYTGLLATGPDSFLLVYSDFRHRDGQGQERKSIMVREVIVGKDKLS